MLGLICILNFIERLDKIYHEVYQDTEGEIKDNLCLKNIMFLSQNSPNKTRLDGFPLVLVIFQIASSCVNLIEDKPYVARNPYEKKEQQFWKHHKKVFRLVGQKYFASNIYDTFNEYMYHMVLTFCLAWRDSMSKVETHLQWNLNQNELRSKATQLEQEKGGYSKGD